MNDCNLDQLIEVAKALRPLLGELVFVGGCVTGLLITDEAAGDPRVTLEWTPSRISLLTRSTQS